MHNPLNVIKEDKPWYQEGLPFKCTECGKCCTGSPGYTWVTEQEIEAIAQHLKLPIETFVQRYLRVVDGRVSLNENQTNYDCAFLKDKKCLIYPVRPKQCRTFPWWQQNLQSKEDWEEAAKRCEGINPTAPLVTFEEIQNVLHSP